MVRRKYIMLVDVSFVQIFFLCILRTLVMCVMSSTHMESSNLLYFNFIIVLFYYDTSEQKIFSRYRKVGHKINVIQQTAYMVANPIMLLPSLIHLCRMGSSTFTLPTGPFPI